MNRSLKPVVIAVGLFAASGLSLWGGPVAQGKDQPVATRPAADAATQPSTGGQSAATQPATQPADTEDTPLHRSVKSTIVAFKEKDSSIKKFFENSKGYVVFPEITKGGLVVGGAHGDGEVYENGVLIGYAQISQATVGLQAGGQSYGQIIFFDSQEKLDDFKKEKLEFAAQVSGVAVKEGAAASHDYAKGVAVFTLPKGGLMGEASIGGQKFKYKPK